MPTSLRLFPNDGKPSIMPKPIVRSSRVFSRNFLELPLWHTNLDVAGCRGSR